MDMTCRLAGAVALQAAVLRAKLPTLADRIARRRAIAWRYDRRLERLDLVPPREAPGTLHLQQAYAQLGFRAGAFPESHVTA